MEPSLKSGQLAIFAKANNYENQIILASTNQGEMVKRLKGSSLVGDNTSPSHNYSGAYKIKGRLWLSL